MKVTVKNSLLIGIAILQSHIWIVLTQKEFKDNSENDTNSSNDEKPKTSLEDENVLQTSLLIFISSSLLSITTSSVLGMSVDYLSSHSTQTPYIQGTAILVDADPMSLLNVSIQHSFIDATSTHQFSHFATSRVVDVPTSYLLNSSYLLETYNLFENSFYLLNNSNSHAIDDPHLISSPFISKGIDLSSSYDSYAFIESDVKETDFIPFRESVSQSPSAESRILIMSSIYASSPIEFFTHENIKTSTISSEIIQSSIIINSLEQNEHVLHSYSINEENTNFINYKPTVSLPQKISTDFSNFFIETSLASSKYQLNIDSTKVFSETELSTASKTDSTEYSSLGISLVEERNDSNKVQSHEIITDDKDTKKNKTFRNEGAEIDEIISGIIHLLAGNVQVARPTKHGYGLNPTRLHLPLQPSLVSTRINNRGPIRPNSFSRTVVVFSQPPNNGHPTELALPGHLLPSTIPNAPFVRIRPTKVGEHPPSAVSVIHFYKQGPKPLPPQGSPNPLPPPPPPQVPFRGEVFNPNNRPPNNNIRRPTHPGEYLRPTFINPEKQQIPSGNLGNKYQHFIFSDDAASSVVVVRPSKPPLVETFPNVSPEIPPKESSKNENLPSQSFEVLIDDTHKKKVYVSQANTLSGNSYDNFNKKRPSHSQMPSNTVIFPTRTEDIFPYGPVTDWVPFSERPSMRDRLNETGTLAADTNISIIMHPDTFDLTVSNSVNNVDNSKGLTTNQNIHSDIIETTTTFNNQLNSSLDTKIIPTSETESMPFNSTIVSNEYLPSDSHFPQTESVINNTAEVSEVQSVNSTTDAGKISTPSVDITPTHTIRESPTKTLIISSTSDLRSSEIQGSYSTKEKTFVENTEISEFSTTYSSPKLDLTLSSKHIKPSIPTSDQTLLGRPIVIPVDIEEVRPFVGQINPPSQGQTGPDRKKDNSYLGHFTRGDGSTTEDTLHRTTASTTRTPIIRSQARPRPNTVRIDTCIVGDDSTCDITLNETCKTEMGISSCHCRAGYARSYARAPCIPIVSLMLSMKVDRFGNKKVTFSPKYMDNNSEEYRVMEFEAKVALTSLISQIPAFARTFLGMQVNAFYPIGEKLVVNSTIFLEEKESTRTQAVRLRLRQLIGEAIKNKKQNIGDSRLYVESSYSPITAIEDVNECSDSNLNDCSEEGTCFNVFGTYLCKCRSGYVDPFVHDERRSGRKCSACSPEYCSFHGKCFVERDKRLCKCHGNYIGSRCEIDGEVLGVALGASLAAIIIILLTLGCLCIWNRKWKQQQQKAEVLSSRSYNSNQTFSYMGNVMNGNANPYHLTVEDRMRWAQISDVIKNISVQPNPELSYLPPTPAPLDQATFQNRCQPNEEEISWYECRTRPRSRIMGQYAAVPGPACFEMDISGRGPYAGTSYPSSKRHKNPGMRY